MAGPGPGKFASYRKRTSRSPGTYQKLDGMLHQKNHRLPQQQHCQHPGTNQWCKIQHQRFWTKNLKDNPKPFFCLMFNGPYNSNNNDDANSNAHDWQQKWCHISNETGNITKHSCN